MDRPMRHGWRQIELAAFAEHVRWLDPARARASYEYASTYSSDEHYGLNPETVSHIEFHALGSQNVAVHWVRERLPNTGSVLVVFGVQDVLVAATEFFLENWPNLFCPGRDDALILAAADDWVLFYCHEDELEYGHRTAVV